jgi:bilirubin oxidase
MAAVGGMMGAQALTGPFQLNGTDFDMNVVNIEVDLNNTEVWTLVNQSALSHPFHIHDIQFNIQEINGVPPPPHLQGWKDVVLVPSMMGSVQFITKFEDFADPEIPYMYHCHILIHEEGGMMGQFVVLDREGLMDDINDNIIKIYPNPAHDKINIEGYDGEVVIYDISGKIVIRDFGGEINIEKLNQGIYLIEYLTESTAKRSVFVVK